MESTKASETNRTSVGVTGIGCRLQIRSVAMLEGNEQNGRLHPEGAALFSKYFYN